MALNIKNSEVERLVDEVTRVTGENKTVAVQRALEERRMRLVYQIDNRDRTQRIQRFLEREVWPMVPDEELGRRLSKAEEEEILGYGREGA